MPAIHRITSAKNLSRGRFGKVIKHYIDRAFSAKTDNRPEFQQMIKDSGKKLFIVFPGYRCAGSDSSYCSERPV